MRVRFPSPALHKCAGQRAGHRLDRSVRSGRERSNPAATPRTGFSDCCAVDHHTSVRASPSSPLSSNASAVEVHDVRRTVSERGESAVLASCYRDRSKSPVRGSHLERVARHLDQHLRVPSPRLCRERGVGRDRGRNRARRRAAKSCVSSNSTRRPCELLGSLD
jgi:hypothetical protein